MVINITTSYIEYKKQVNNKLHLKQCNKISICHRLVLRLKSGSHHSKKKVFVCFNESPLKMMKNAFYFTLKGLYVLKIFDDLNFWSCRKNGLMRHIWVISKAYDGATWFTDNNNTDIT